MTYFFRTKTTMKNSNSEYWIDDEYVRDFFVEAENLNDALRKYRKFVEEKCCIEVSDSAMKNKENMFVDTSNGDSKQIGYVITGKTDFRNNEGRFIQKYISLWVRINCVVDVDFE